MSVFIKFYRSSLVLLLSSGIELADRPHTACSTAQTNTSLATSHADLQNAGGRAAVHRGVARVYCRKPRDDRHSVCLSRRLLLEDVPRFIAVSLVSIAENPGM
ncbi:hypothetical protein B566_EDAN013661, partial [Ephemera danica]